jgi:hypothetical protein
MEESAEKRENLWTLAASPLVWAVHFLLSYGVAAVWCARFVGEDGSLLPVRVAIAAFTLVALSIIAWIGTRAWRRHRLRGGRAPHDEDTSLARHRFLGFAVVLLSSLSAVAVAYSAMVVVFVRSCR